MPGGPNIIRDMSIWNKVLIGLNIVAALVMSYLLVRALRTQQYWEEAVAKHEQAQENPAENHDLMESEKLPNGFLGIMPAKQALETVLIGRGRVWSNCVPASIDHQTGEVALNIAEPIPPGIATKMTVYVMSGAKVKEGGRYLGAFEVTQVAEQRSNSLRRTSSMRRRSIGWSRIRIRSGPYTNSCPSTSTRPSPPPISARRS